MALFQKNPHVQPIAPLYTLGANKTLLIIGLGNIGQEYTRTRHNVGFNVIDEFAAKNNFPTWIDKKDLKSRLSAKNMGESRVILIKPNTYMNASGDAAQLVQHFYRVYNQNTLVIYDELAIPFGQIRIRVGGSDAGHNGVKSLIQQIGDDFGRLRVGIGSGETPARDSSEYVLGRFTKAQQENLGPIIKEASAIISEYIFGGQLTHETRTIL